MRVALNVIGLGAQAGGVGRFATALPGALLEAEPGLELVLVSGRERPPDLAAAPWAGEVRWMSLPFGLHGRAHMAAQLAALPAAALARRCDLVHSPANVGPPRLPRLPSVVTVHDLIWHHAGTDWGPPEAVAAMRRIAIRSARWATRVQADSSATRDDLVGLAGLDRARVDVVPLGVSVDPAAWATPEAELRMRLDLGDGPVVLTVAQKRPYKNLDVAIRAISVLAPDVRLVLPGAPTPHEEQLRALAAALGVADRVRFVDWVGDADLEGLYRLAACVLVPSRYEGFGLPVLEAMARGVPVACADAMSLPEVAGDAALRFDPTDAGAAAGAVARLLGDEALRADLVRRGRERAAGFTWRRAAEAALAGYRRALDR